MKLGVFGGTFDPIHIGHMIVAEEARIQVGLDKVFFIPAGQPWFKAERSITDGIHRMKMVEAAIATNEHFQASDIELKRSGATYTVETLTELLASEGQTECYLIIGLDALREVDRWQQPERILDMVTLVGVARPGNEALERAPLEKVRPGAAEAVIVVSGPLVGVSSTDIRRRVSEGASIRDQVPGPVERYIYEHGLYRADTEIFGDG